MNKLTSILALTVLPTLFLANCKQEEKQKPNMLLILIDDMGWKDVGYAGSNYYETPNIDRLAEQGLIFTNGYSNAPVCSPSRGALLTGKNPAATQFTCVFGNHVPVGDSLFKVSRDAGGKTNQYNEALHRHAVPRDVKMLSQNIKEAGYKTAFFGKWHCGSGEGYQPQDRGFETAVGYRPQHSSTKGHYIKSFRGNIAGLEKYDTSSYVSEVLTKECIKFLTENKGRPFMAVLSHYLVHRPLQGLPELVEKYKKRETDDQNIPEYAAMVESVDRSVGNIMKALDSLGLSDNTILVFTSDNGGLVPKSTSNYPLMGGKSYPFEAGMKVPFIIRWPKMTQNGKTDERVIGTDIFPTFLDAAGIPLDTGQTITGTSLLPILKGDTLNDRPLIFHFPHYTHATGPFSSVIYKDWKLIKFYNDEEGPYLLYNLERDPYEQDDLSDEDTLMLKQLDHMLREELDEMNAEFPISNEDYIPYAPENQNRKTTLELGLKEREMLEKRISTKGKQN